MIELYINKIRAVLPDDLSFTFLQENPYFTNNSNSTLDIELPLQGNVNRSIFGYVDRMDVAKKRAVMEAELRVSGIIYLYGSAIITDITESSVTIQLVSGNSEFNFRTNSDIYIDDIDLGKIVFPTFPVSTTWLPASDKTKYFGSVDQVEAVWLPVKFGDDIHNMIVYQLGSENFHPRPWWNDHCVQPYLLTVIDRLVKWAGYKIGKNAIAESFLRNLYVVNAVQTDVLAKALPHWTISEFWDEIEKFCSVIIVVDELTKEVNFLPMNEFFNDNDRVYIDSVVSEYSVEVNDSGNEKDITTGNVGYDLDSNDLNKYYCVDRSVLSKIEPLTFSTKADLVAYYNNLKDEDKVSFWGSIANRNHINYIDEDGSYALREVNRFGDLIRDETDDSNNVSLKIVPATMECYNLGVYNSYNDPRLGVPMVTDLRLWVPVTSYFTELPKDEKINIQEAIESNTTSGSGRDIMEVAFNTGSMANISVEYQGQKHAYNYNCPFTDGNMILPNQNNGFPAYSLSLHVVCKDCIGYLIDNTNRISSDILYNIQFLYDGKLDPKKVFIINNQKYVCEHLEIEADNNRFSRLVNGYFYRIG